MDGYQLPERLTPPLPDMGGVSSRRSQIVIAVVACQVAVGAAFAIGQPVVMVAIGLLPFLIV